MTFRNGASRCLFALWLLVYGDWNANAEPEVISEFIGTTPAGALPREFLGGLASTAACHSVTWKITFSTNQNSVSTFELKAAYAVPARDHPNRSRPGPKVRKTGTWEIMSGIKFNPNATVYRISSEERALSLVLIGDALLHLLAEDKTLMSGNGGWSYTLNRADHAEKPGKPDQAPEMSYKISPLATGPTVFGVFEGRTPCIGIARVLHLCYSLDSLDSLDYNPGGMGL